MEIKKCPQCNLTKELIEFGKNPKRRNGINSWCKVCTNNHNKMMYHVKKKETAQKDKIYFNKIKSRYGLTRDEYKEILDRQTGLCAVCNGEPFYKKLQVDHNHQTRVVRGLLCRDCNRILGQAKDDISILEAAIEYLKKNGV